MVAGIRLGKAFLHQQGVNQFFPKSKVCVASSVTICRVGAPTVVETSSSRLRSRSPCRWVSVSRALTLAVEAGCSCCSRALGGQREGAPSARLLGSKQLHVLGLLGSPAVASVHTRSRTEPGHRHTSVACESGLLLLIQTEHSSGVIGLSLNFFDSVAVVSPFILKILVPNNVAYLFARIAF